ncbi:MAG: aldehyde dehydrogenase family protein, partial [Clostridia bacterium]
MNIPEQMAAQQAYFQTGATLEISFRRNALHTLKKGLIKHETSLLEALCADLGKSSFEAYLTELSLVRGAIDETISALTRWTRPRRVPTPLSHFPGNSRVLRDPYGLVAILAPWNYPLQLCLLPLVGILAAGNCAVVKPSKDAPHTAQAIGALLKSCFEPEYVSFFTGNREVNQEILHGPCDLIFFTGSPAVGREVMRAAAERLTPVVLELGGKSPCIVLEDADVALAARRIAWAKLLNAGQTCVAPDYVLVSRKLEKPLLEALASQMRVMFGENPRENPEFPHIVNVRHFQRLMGLMSGGRIVTGGRGEEDTLHIAPTVLTDVLPDAPVMQEEIFGPILPVLPFDTLQDALAKVRARPLPLACYLFTRNVRAGREILRTLRFGSGCINDCVMQLANPHLPFGGVGESGMGCYHAAFPYA